MSEMLDCIYLYFCKNNHYMIVLGLRIGSMTLRFYKILGRV